MPVQIVNLCRKRKSSTRDGSFAAIKQKRRRIARIRRGLKTYGMVPRDPPRLHARCTCRHTNRIKQQSRAHLKRTVRHINRAQNKISYLVVRHDTPPNI